jgi:hypothetical protein
LYLPTEKFRDINVMDAEMRHCVFSLTLVTITTRERGQGSTGYRAMLDIMNHTATKNQTLGIQLIAYHFTDRHIVARIISFKEM